ncbi:MAG TPA: hypothetical protein VIZ28_16700 [Chitinophagaceae bacterium]
MKNITLFAILLAIFAATGCLNDSNTKIERAEPVPQIAVPPASSNPNTGITPVTQPVPATITPVAAPVTTATPASTAKLNPAHGQPGHRCDISVGAPLDSKPGQAIAQPQATTTPANIVTPTIAQPVTAPQTAAPGLNPAHGQPGHRCDIAVGAPLNSKPAQ